MTRDTLTNVMILLGIAMILINTNTPTIGVGFMVFAVLEIGSGGVEFVRNRSVSGS